MSTSNYDGLTRNVWPGTWSTGTNSPIALDTELRGTLQSISGASGDRLTDIPGARIAEGMLVYVKTGYSAGPVTRSGDTYYKYKLGTGESRSGLTGAVPNAEANWSEVTFSSGGGGGAASIAAPAFFTGNGIKKDFSPVSGLISTDASKCLVIVGGVIQTPNSSYTVSLSNGGTLSFDEAPPNGLNVTIRPFQ